MVHLSFTGSRRRSASSLAGDSASGASPGASDDEGKVARKSPTASYLGKLWRWGGDSSGSRHGLFGSRASQVCCDARILFAQHWWPAVQQRSNLHPVFHIHDHHAGLL